ncbi:FG-GAP repeat domain-containing protein [Sorangium sp. So ce362]|uniref:FG-GAP repeat domain-containing protein n=1 Tax=Sorangium sp. So ce362 TaxID=3133303 RepID=UPI003F62F693
MNRAPTSGGHRSPTTAFAALHGMRAREASLRTFMQVVRALGVAAAIPATAACARGVDPGDEGRPIGPSAPSPGAATQRRHGDGWEIIQTADFNADRMADVIWYDAERNRIAVWLMNGSDLLAPGPFIPGPGGDGWVVWANDFDADSMADLLWSHEERHLMAVWLMDGSRLRAPGPFIPGPIGGGWTALPGDFDFDRMADVLWLDPDQNQMAVWPMNGVHLLAAGPPIPGPIGGFSFGFPVDVNLDRMADVIWIGIEQDLMLVWLMHGGQPLAAGPVIPGPIGDGWVATGVGDFNADGMIDVLWGNEESGLIAVWLLAGSQLLAAGPVIPGPIGDGWSARAAGDVNLDGMADVIWQRAGTSEMAVWLMEGSRVLAPGPVIPGPRGGD